MQIEECHRPYNLAYSPDSGVFSDLYIFHIFAPASAPSASASATAWCSAASYSTALSMSCRLRHTSNMRGLRWPQ